MHRVPILRVLWHCMMTSWNGNIFRVTGRLCGEFIGHRWIPRTKASDAELWCFLWSAPWINGWVNNREAGDLRRHRHHYDVIVMEHQIIVHEWLGNVGHICINHSPKGIQGLKPDLEDIRKLRKYGTCGKTPIGCFHMLSYFPIIQQTTMDIMQIRSHMQVNTDV